MFFRDYRRLESFHSPLTTYGNHKEITDFGLIVGYGDAFSYKRSGIVVVGESNVGKSQLVKKFHEEELSDILADNELLIFDHGNNGQSEVYRDIFMEPEYLMDLSGEEIVNSCINHLADNQGVPLRVILHLTNSYPRGLLNLMLMLYYLIYLEIMEHYSYPKIIPFLVYCKVSHS